MEALPVDPASLERGVEVLNQLDTSRIEELLYQSCHLALRGWARRVASDAPFEGFAVLEDTASRYVGRLTSREVVEAHRGLKRLGERRDDTSADARWSKDESSGVGSGADLLRRLAEANEAYERRFGHVFLISATGLSGEQILEAIERRLRNSEDAETVQIKTELEKLVRLRLSKLASELGSGTPVDALIEASHP